MAKEIHIKTVLHRIPRCCLSCRYYRHSACCACIPNRAADCVVSKCRSSYCPMTEIQPEKVPVGSDDLGIMLVCAIRYAVGRQSYMPGMVQDFIRPLLPDLSSKALGLMERDLRYSKRNGVLGDPDIDAPGWIRLLVDIRTEMDRRGIERIE